MKIGTTQLIRENIKPPNADKLAIYNGNTKVAEIDISSMIPTNLGAKLYSFGLLSDVHCMGNSNGGTAADDGNGVGNIPNGTQFHKALTFFENQGCDFACVSGDLTNIGFYASTDATTTYLTEFAEYKQICDLHPNLPIYECCGNHESYWGRNITENLDLLEQYTGQGLTYTMTQGNDLFIFVGQSKDTQPMSDEHFTWLANILEANKDKRCFVFIHPYIRPFSDVSDSGDPLRLHKEPLFTYWGQVKTNNFINLMKSYPNVIVFHGHAHMDFENQFVKTNSNYSTILGFKSIHIPSTAETRNVSTGEIVKKPNGSQGYICDVYANHIVLKGYDFEKNDYSPIAQYCIDTRF